MDVDTLLAAHDPASRHPLPGPDSAEAISIYQQIIGSARPERNAARSRRRIAVGVTSGAVAALAVGLTLASLPGGTHSAGTAVGHASPSPGRTAVNAVLTAKQVLDTAAAAALRQPSAAPRPDQFVYTKVGDGGGHVAQTWRSVDGARDGLMEVPGANGTTTILGCVNGERQIRLPGYNGKPYTGPPKPKAPVPLDGPVVTEPCTAQPAFFPAMPATASAMPAYLAQEQGVRLNDVNDVAKVVGGMFESDYLLPAQRAALYEFLATTPGLTLERNVKDISGRPGIGVGWSFMGSKAMLIFDPSTYTLLGMTTWGEQGQVGGDALLQMAITNQAGSVHETVGP
jgi:hypothetical protein